MQSHRSNLPVLALTLALCMVLTSCSFFGGDSEDAASGPDATNVDGTPQVPQGPFNVVGKDIVGPDGNLFVPVGANIGAPLKDSAGADVWLFRLNGDDITSDEAVAAVDAWGWNFLRINALCTARDANDNNAAWGNTEMFAAIDKVVDTYTAKGVVVMVDCHDFTETEGVLTETPEYSEVTEFWKAAAERYGDNSYVWFNHLNEFSKFGESVESWQTVIDDGYQTFKDTGSENLVVFDLPISGQSLPVLLEPEVQEWAKTMCNVIWDWHSYGGLSVEADPSDESAFEAEFEAEMNRVVSGVAAAEMPVLVGEIGYDWDTNRRTANSGSFEKERAGALRALVEAPANGYGTVAWHANGDSGVQMVYGLKASNDLTFAQPAPSESLSEFGTAYLEHSQKVQAAEPQSGPTDTCER